MIDKEEKAIAEDRKAQESRRGTRNKNKDRSGKGSKTKEKG